MSSQLLTFFLLLSAVAIPVVTSYRQWCMPLPTATDKQLQANIDYVCGGQNVDCTPIQPGGSCYEPNTVRGHASYVMNAYYHSHGRIESACNFAKTGCFEFVDPSHGSCVYYT
ncbi:PREDICTED: major pollen allergen Ole e 10-like [Camelina sativa]|uniref:Major pollen allergen Ole e 10-like n=1 Tax=Camelina sativa TaxID=90675 RepID=A0ABM0UPL6_CAMSA|nr:PREDICTED: major pollen allergen Ole e 10-like [Camelina sativa]